MPLRHADPPWTTSLTTICQVPASCTSAIPIEARVVWRFRRRTRGVHARARRAKRRDRHLRGLVLRGHEEQPDAGARCQPTQSERARRESSLCGAGAGRWADNLGPGPATAARSFGAWAAACAAAGKMTSHRRLPCAGSTGKLRNGKRQVHRGNFF
jgi:hypothetical protein